MTVINFCEEDRKLKHMVKTKNLSDSRKRTINIAFNEIYNEFDYTPTELLEKAREDEVQYIDKGIIKQKALDDRIVSIIQEDYKDYLETKEYRGRNLLPRTIQLKLIILRSFLNSFGIELPQMPKISIPRSRPTDEDIPSWEDINDALPNCKSPRDKAILAFAVTTGLRVSDIVSRKISDLIQACDIYFEENEEHTLENLLKKDASKITPCWELMPQKTGEYENSQNNYTITFNTPETTEFIFKYLKYRIDLDIKNDGDGKINPNEALFRSQRKSNIEGHLPVSTIEFQFRAINEKLGGDKQKNNVYAKFSPHSLRKLFKTTCTIYLSESYNDSNKVHIKDIASILTGHSSDQNDMNELYVAIPKDNEDSFLRKAYESLIPHLSIRPTKVNVLSTKEYKTLQKENEQLKKNYEELQEQLKQTNKRVDDTEETLGLITKEKTYNSINNSIYNYVMDNFFHDNPNEEELLVLLATDYAVEHKDEFDYTDDYIKRIIKRVRLQIEFDGRPIQNQLNSYFLTSNGVGMELQHNIQLVLDKIMDSEKIMDILGDSVDLMKLEDLIEKELSKYDEDLSDEDVNNIILDVAMQY